MRYLLLALLLAGCGGEIHPQIRCKNGSAYLLSDAQFSWCKQHPGDRDCPCWYEHDETK